MRRSREEKGPNFIVIGQARPITKRCCGGFTLIEVLVSILIIGILGSMASVNFNYIKSEARDSVAQNDYYNVKLGVQAAISNSIMPDRFIVRGQIGPGALPAPLSEIILSSDVSVDVAHVVREGTYLTTIEVAHLRGALVFRFVDQDGVITEQVLQR